MTINKKLLVTIIILVLLGVAGAIFSRNGSKITNPFSKKMNFDTIEDAIKYGKGLKCELVQNLPGQTNRMTIYTQNGNLREEASTAVGTTYVLVNKDFTYMWNTITPSVAKIPLAQAQRSNELLLQTKIPTYNCSEQSLPETLFNPPR